MAISATSQGVSKESAVLEEVIITESSRFPSYWKYSEGLVGLLDKWWKLQLMRIKLKILNCLKSDRI